MKSAHYFCNNPDRQTNRVTDGTNDKLTCLHNLCLHGRNNFVYMHENTFKISGFVANNSAIYL